MQQKHIEAMTDEQMITQAFNQCIGNITLATDRVERERRKGKL